MVCDFDLKTGLYAWVDESSQIYNAYSDWDLKDLTVERS